MPKVARGQGVDVVNTGHPVCVSPGKIRTLSGSDDTFIEGAPVHRQNDTNDPHTHCPPVYSTRIVRGSSDVFVNGRQVARERDRYDCGAFVETVNQSKVFAN